MKNIVIPLRLLVCGLFVLMSYSQAFAVISSLALDPKKPNVLVPVNLPFRYKSTEGKEIKFVYQGGSHLLTTDSEAEYMVIGPAQPCVAIVVSDLEKKVHLGLHMHWPNSYESLNQMVTEKLRGSDFSKLRVQIFSYKLPGEGYLGYARSGGERTQLAEMQKIPESLRKLGILQKNIQLMLWQSRYSDWDLGQYESAELSILIDKDGNIFSTCFFAEDLLKLRGKKVDPSLLFPGFPETLRKGIVNVQDPGSGDVIEVRDGKINYDSLTLRAKFAVANAQMSKDEDLHYKLYTKDKKNYTSILLSAECKDAQARALYRAHEFYFVPNKVKSRAEMKSAPAEAASASASASSLAGASPSGFSSPSTLLDSGSTQATQVRQEAGVSGSEKTRAESGSSESKSN